MALQAVCSKGHSYIQADIHLGEEPRCPHCRLDSVTAGREMDALIAEKVMGLKPCTKWVQAAGGSLSQIHISTNCDVPPPDECYDVQGAWIKKYSTSIEAAWEVFERIESTSRNLHQYGESKKEWGCGFYGNGDPPNEIAHSYAPTAPLAICRAALRTVQNDK